MEDRRRLAAPSGLGGNIAKPEHCKRREHVELGPVDLPPPAISRQRPTCTCRSRTPRWNAMSAKMSHPRGTIRPATTPDDHRSRHRSPTELGKYSGSILAVMQACPYPPRSAGHHETEQRTPFRWTRDLVSGVSQFRAEPIPKIDHQRQPPERSTQRPLRDFGREYIRETLADWR